MSTINIHWKSIRPLNGSRANGFEELCAQLANAERPGGSRFERKGSPDAGVECYAILEDGREWGWQAKYFDEFGDSQWSQLDDSVKTALEKHPRLARYFVCVPLDRSDARLGGRRSAKNRWDEHVQKWITWASARGMTVEFLYWGSYELLERITRPEHIGRVRFWFDVRRFDMAWFTARLDEALRAAGPRYTPEIHVELPIASELDAFGRTERFFDQVKSRARGLRRKLRSFEYSESKNVDPTLDALRSALAARVQKVLAELGAIAAQPIGDLPFKRIADQIVPAEACAKELDDSLREREREYDARPPETEAGAVKKAPRSDNPFRDRRDWLRTLSYELRSCREVLVHAGAVAGNTLMLLKGTAGSGKTHLLCDIARQRIAASRPYCLWGSGL